MNMINTDDLLTILEKGEYEGCLRGDNGTKGITISGLEQLIEEMKWTVLKQKIVGALDTFLCQNIKEAGKCKEDCTHCWVNRDTSILKLQTANRIIRYCNREKTKV